MGRLTTTLSFGVARFANERAVDVNVVEVDEALALVRSFVKDDVNSRDGHDTEAGKRREAVGGKGVRVAKAHARPVGMTRNGRVRPVGAAKEVVDARWRVDVEARSARAAMSIIAVVKAESGERDSFDSINCRNRSRIRGRRAKFGHIEGVI